MTDVQQWLEERRTIREATTEDWEHDPEEDGTNFWAGGGRSDFHLTVADAAFAVDAHEEFPKALAVIEAVLDKHKPAVDVPGVCDECSILSADVPLFEPYPCATVRVMEEAKAKAEA